MILASLLLGIFSSIGLILIFVKTPKRVQLFFCKYKLLAEILSFVFFMFTITSITQSLIGVLGAFIAAFIWSAYISIKSKKILNHRS